MGMGFVNDMRFVGAASYAAPSFVSSASAKARRRHDEIVQLQKKYNQGPLPFGKTAVFVCRIEKLTYYNIEWVDIAYDHIS